MVSKPITPKIHNSIINQRIEKYRDPSINQDGSIDCRKRVKPVKERVRALKSTGDKASGQYTRETASGEVKFKLVIYPYDLDHIYRRDMKTGFETAILEKIDGEWFPCCILRQSEIQALKSFPGAAGMDCDRAIEKDRCKVKYEPTSKNVGGRCTPKGTSKRGYSKPRTNNKFKNLMESVQVHNAHSKKKFRSDYE